MVSTRPRRRSRSRRVNLVVKPQGTVHPRVQKVGPQYFGVVSVDCAKARSKWMLADFYGKVQVPPTVVAHTRADLDATIAQLREAMEQHRIRDVFVAVERTGRYHHVTQRAFAAAGFETRVVHPFATKQFRQPANPGNKTDDTDLAAIHRAAVNGFALAEEPPEESWVGLQLLARHRRNLVRKASTLCCQIREHLHAAMPGYANPKTITGRAGLYPSRAQSDQVDHADGPLTRCANRQLRYAILQIADCLITRNKYFGALAQRWKAAGKDPRHSRVRVGSRFVRISYHMVAERNVFRHPFARDRHYIVQKLLTFHRAHGTPMAQTLADAQAVIEQLPKHAYAGEAVPLVQELEAIQERRRRRPQPIGEILPLLLARLGVVAVQSGGSGDHGPR